MTPRQRKDAEANNLFTRPQELELATDSYAYAYPVTVSDPVLLGHYPHMPIVPGTLLLELMTHAIGRFTRKQLGFEFETWELKRLTFLAPVTPEEILHITGQCRSKGVGYEVKTQVHAQQPVARATFRFAGRAEG